jgi:hypothetical protein
MKRCGICVFVLLAGLATASAAADSGNTSVPTGAAKELTLPPIQWGGYSIDLDTRQPTESAVPLPPGLSTLEKPEPTNPFVGLTHPFIGLTLKKPLSEP